MSPLGMVETPRLASEEQGRVMWSRETLPTGRAHEARAELISRALKYAYALGKIPRNDFQANEAIFQIVLLAYNLLSWLKRLCVPPHLQRATLQRLRQRLFMVPAQLVRPDGVPTLHLAPSYPWASDFLETLKRTRRLRPPF